jgi:uncharacterized RmlC-like cupin family protein
MTSQFGRRCQIWHCECTKGNKGDLVAHNPHQATAARRLDDGQSFQGESMQYQSIRVVRRDQLASATAQTPGSQRLAAIHPGAGMASPMWGGVFCVEPAACTAIHHHGEQHTIAYVLSGSSYVRWGERGECDTTLHAGDFLYVPAWLPHQEINPSNTLSFQWIVVRSTSEPIVVNLPNTFWEEARLLSGHSL